MHCGVQCFSWAAYADLLRMPLSTPPGACEMLKEWHGEPSVQGLSYRRPSIEEWKNAPQRLDSPSTKLYSPESNHVYVRVKVNPHEQKVRFPLIIFKGAKIELTNEQIDQLVNFP
jgi:hypothetical protein